MYDFNLDRLVQDTVFTGGLPNATIRDVNYASLVSATADNPNPEEEKKLHKKALGYWMSSRTVMKVRARGIGK